MNPLRPGLAALGFALLLAARPARADIVTRPDGNDVLQLAGRTETGRPLSVRIALREPDFEDLHEKHVQERDLVGSDWWGGPHRMISTFEVRIGSAFIPLARSAYADLADVRTLSLATTRGGFVLTIAGGGNGEAYTARLRFRRGYLMEREVRHDEIGLAEKTEYSYPRQVH